MRALQVLIVDDEPAIRQILSNALTKAGHTVQTAANGEEALEKLSKGEIEVCLSDIRMPDMTGIDVVKMARKQGIDTTFLMMTAFASVSTAIEAMRAGAYDYMLKPLRNEDVINRLERLSDVIRLKSENEALKKLVQKQDEGVAEMPSAAMKAVYRLIDKVAPTDSTVMITGPSGAGKSILAKTIHNRSDRADRPFVAVNCGAIPENLLESEFFGHTKGAFTGASKAKRGLFVEADGGTIFLDEIGELPLNLQVKLLHVLEEKQVRAVGSEQSRKVDVRIVAATNKNLEQMVAQGEFREDLFFRLNVFQIELPPLARRPEDIDQLIDFMLDKQTKEDNATPPYAMDDQARMLLRQYEWPGNVRELQNVISRAIILAENNLIRAEDLPPAISRIQGASGGHVSISTRGTLKEQLRAYEIAIIRKTIDECDGDRREAARRLGIGLSSLYRKLEEADHAT